ncbi:glycerophosphoryl diester phosphodiesterase membrane domain-containing protein [Nonomuraea rhodomycinica]|uniref:Glycerophosphoryl diester phosphodiesterase membrane domain-containing protein n=1 Tax=Nonomuraea rhodomycinica TaxID=1712872 RepID=A0A7Y6INA5_9ACTN|nr:glycerophosphoryl diester phosphodiesterase membrane domain-containing protein [Nonomuraea rhodomycinica]NUW41091.1 glycerophosphoryl diester phosphodiesterase membrane domain-containing protein [Nonomuraea rhodomycinica]
MSDGHGPSPETPPGWAAEQPPPYGPSQASPWTAPGSAPGAPHGGGPEAPFQQAPHAPYPPHPQQPTGGSGYGLGHGYAYGIPQAPRPGIIPLRPLRLGDILDGAIKLVRSNPKAVLGLSAVAALLASLPLAVGQAFVLGSMRSTLRDAYTDPYAEPTGVAGGFVAQYGGSLVSAAVSFVVVTVLTGVLTRILGRAVFGGSITAGEAWRLTRGRLPALFGMVGLLVAVLAVPLVAFLGILLALYATGSVSGGGLAALLLVMVLLYLPYLVFFRTKFGLAAPAVVLEGMGPVAALRRSWQLVSGDFWRVFGIMLLTSIIVGVAAAILQVPFTFVGMLLGLLGDGAGATVSAVVLIAVGGTVGAMITYPIEAGVSGLLYADRRMRSEAFDLVLQTAAVEQQRQGWVHASADDLWRPTHTPAP